MRQTLHCHAKRSALITTLTYDFADGYVIPEHFHQEDQLVYASHGVMSVRTKDGTWVVPPQRGVWIPARTPHGITMSGAVSMRTLYLKPRLVRPLPRSCRVLNVSSLLRELILHACKLPALEKRTQVQARLVEVIVDQLEAVQAIPLQLPSPLDPRAARVAKALADDRSGSCRLEETCRMAGASKRTIERLFLQETRLTLGQWRQQLRLMRSLQLLAAGHKITHVALEAGYSTPSAFIAMFRKILGVTPGRYFDNSP